MPGPTIIQKKIVLITLINSAAPMSKPSTVYSRKKITDDLSTPKPILSQKYMIILRIRSSDRHDPVGWESIVTDVSDPFKTLAVYPPKSYAHLRCT